MKARPFNTTILCVDDDENILNTYQSILTKPKELETVSKLMSLLGPVPAAKDTSMDFHVLLAHSGEAAVQIVERQLRAGSRVVAGFFDMRMPGGMDGHATIAQIKSLDPDILCAVVSAYSDKPIFEVRKLFQDGHQDELLYFKKPFDPEELEQAAYNMVSAWNRKRNEEFQRRIIEKHRQGLSRILNALSTLSKIPPYSLRELVSGLLLELLGLVGGEHGFVLLQSNQLPLVHAGVGKFEHTKDFLQYIQSVPEFRGSLNDNTIHVDSTACFLPLVCGPQKIGAMYVEAMAPFEKGADGEILNIFRTQMVNLILNTLFYDEILEKDSQTITDPLTNLFNRRFLLKRLREELNRASRHLYSIAVFMVDIDDFKRINDTYGHEIGDRLLIGVANILRTTVRDYDIVGRDGFPEGTDNKFAIRYGGEEFTLVLLQIDEQNAALVGERIRQKVESFSIDHEGHTIKVTVSLGVVLEKIDRTTFLEGDCVETLLARADKALYVAKQNGKNRVAFYSAAMRPATEGEHGPSTGERPAGKATY